MKKNKLSLIMSFFSLVLFGSFETWAQKTQLKVDDIQADQDTSITIQKGVKAIKSEPDYEIVSGTDELSGDEEFDDKKAVSSWKESCEKWKSEIRELNADNKMIFLSCGSRKKSKEKDKTTYTSKASYKIRVRIRDVK